jgi:uncharacterized BrkB/YihY/UPF0761 family membrane protein
VVLLVWVYYSALAFFLGAELTQGVARLIGSPITPSAHAQWVAGKDREPRTP